MYVDGGVGVCSTALREAVESAVCKSKSGIAKMPPKENRDDRNAKRPANTGNVRAGRCYVRGMISLTLSCRKKGVYLGSRGSHYPCPPARRCQSAPHSKHCFDKLVLNLLPHSGHFAAFSAIASSAIAFSAATFNINPSS